MFNIKFGRWCIFFSLSLLFQVTGFAQNVAKKKTAPAATEQPVSKKVLTLEALSKFDGNKIMLRWAPTNFETWVHGMKNGYTIYRKKSGGKEAFVKITNSPILPVSKKELESRHDTSNATKIAMMATEVLGPITLKSNTAEAFEQQKNLEIIYALCMAGSGLYPQAAKDMGLNFEDTNIEPNTLYEYKIETSKPFQLKELSKTIFVNTGKKYEQPAVSNIKILFTEKHVTLSWRSNYPTFSFAYFDIYRAEKASGDFVKLNPRPFIGSYSNDAYLKSNSIFTDSVPEMGKTYYYKIIGFGPFGDASPPEEIVSGKAVELLKNGPEIIQVSATSMNEVVVEWSIDPSEQNNVDFFDVQRSADGFVKFESLGKVKPKQKLIFSDKIPLSDGYYRVKAVGLAGDSMLSATRLMHMVDSLPPAIPSGLRGYVDSNFVAHLSWNKNTEKDFYGYRVFRLQHKKDVLTRLTSGTVSDTTYTDTLSSLNNLKTVYYKIAAIDQIGNGSILTLPLELKRPDKLKPQTPEISRYMLVKKGVMIRWIPCGSDDLAQQQLLRKGPLDLDWQVIKNIPLTDTTNFFVDSTTTNNQVYRYTMKAIDESGLVCLPAKVIEIKTSDFGVKPAVLNFSVLVNRPTKEVKLSWVYNQEGIKEFKIYRAKQGAKPELYMTIAKDQRELYDKRLTVNTKYSYKMKAVFNDYSESPMTNLVEVAY